MGLLNEKPDGISFLSDSKSKTDALLHVGTSMFTVGYRSCFMCLPYMCCTVLSILLDTIALLFVVPNLFHRMVRCTLVINVPYLLLLSIWWRV